MMLKVSDKFDKAGSSDSRDKNPNSHVSPIKGRSKIAALAVLLIK